MLHVVIDTSLYRRDPKRSKAAFRAFTRLCQGKKITLYLPELVENEFLSQQKIAIEEDIQKIATVAKSIQRKTQDKKLDEFSSSIVKSADKVLSRVQSLTVQEFLKWAKTCRAVRLKIHPDHASRVMKDYFAGNAPFSSVKNRADIPDSFIWQAILDIAAKKKKLYVIVHDGQVLKSAQSHEKIVAFQTLEDFVESPEFKEAIEELTSEVVTKNIKRAQAIIPTLDDSLKHMVEFDIVDALAHKKVKHRSIPDDNNEAMIMGVGKPYSIEFDFSKIEFYGGSEIGIPFMAEVECELSYAIYKGEYYVLDESKMAKIGIDDLNDHYYDADETYQISASGTLSVELETKILVNAKSTDEEIETAIEEGDHDVEIDDISVIAPEYDPY